MSMPSPYELEYPPYMAQLFDMLDDPAVDRVVFGPPSCGKTRLVDCVYFLPPPILPDYLRPEYLGPEYFLTHSSRLQTLALFAQALQIPLSRLTNDFNAENYSRGGRCI